MSGKNSLSRNLGLRKELRKSTDFALARLTNIIGVKAERLRRSKADEIWHLLSVLLTEKKQMEKTRRVHFQTNDDLSKVPYGLVNRLVSHNILQKDALKAKESPLKKEVFEHVQILTALQAKQAQEINYKDATLKKDGNLIAQYSEVSAKVNRR
jgi:uncharacterized protein YdhG (YjbR/CyaY superfamily)